MKYAGLVLAMACLFLSACTSVEDFSVLGYTTQTRYAREIRTIRVPIFKNRTFLHGIEVPLTESVVKQIEGRTPWRVVSGDADTELTGTIIAVPKRIITHNTQNEVREAEVTLGVEIVWRDLRSGEILSNAPRSPNSPPPAPGLPPGTPPPLFIQRSATFIPELGQSTASAKQRAVDDLAVQIVEMMENPW